MQLYRRAVGAGKRHSAIIDVMPPATTSTPLVGTTGPLSGIEAELLVVPLFEGETASAVSGLDAALGGELARALASKEFQAKTFETFLAAVTDASWRARRIAVIGGGSPSAGGGDLMRKVATVAGLLARQKRVATGAVALRGHTDLAGLAQACAEGLTLAEFHSGTYKTSDPPPPVPSWIVAAQGDTRIDAAALDRAISRGRVLGESTNLARELANEPGNTLTPREFAARAAKIASEGGAQVEILDEHQIAELGMGLLLGVARGSSEPPRLIVFRHDPPGAPKTPVLGLVGKGITFDTGGISIKPAEGMERMKDDMAGGAAVACAMRAIARLGAPMRVVGVVPATENMPGGSAIKPGDILKSAEGKTVEVINTDAEGRLILGDGLWYARRLGATHLIDVATLTGAVVVALGKLTSGIFGTPDAWVERVRRVAERAGDRMWPMPVFDDYKEQLKSEIADFTNTGGRPAGSITAALFLKEFTGGLPWAHLDIAGTAWADEARPYMPKGATGAAVRTLAELAFEQF
jgi:leucyl aminopeptidase